MFNTPLSSDDRYALVFFFIGTFYFGTSSYFVLRNEWRKRHWLKREATIMRLSPTPFKVGVNTTAYRYEVDGREYTAVTQTSLGHVVGGTLPILVNPKKPSQSEKTLQIGSLVHFLLSIPIFVTVSFLLAVNFLL